jgi:two-component system phosphate regulon sensor histidine kinase PhoR
MKNASFRRLLILALTAMVCTTVLQGFWFVQAFDLKEKQFNQQVTIALKQVAHLLLRDNQNFSPVGDAVSQPASNYFVVMVNDQIDANLLEVALRSEFEKRQLKLDFEYGIYDCSSEELRYGDYISAGQWQKDKRSKLPRVYAENNYFSVLFPTKRSSLMGQMGIWLFSAAVVLLVLVFFTYTLYIIFRQKRLSEIQKDFVNTMTHEFKTPLSNNAISAETLRQPAIGNQPERLLNYVGIIQTETARLRQQVERVLQMSIADRDRIELKMEKISVNEALEKAMQAARLQHPQPELIQLKLDMAPLTIRADQLHFNNVLYNLIDNALKYSPDHSPLELAALELNGLVHIRITDQGPGMAPEFHKRIFQKFYRIPTGYVHDVKGFGLGLYYVAELVKLMGGQLKLESAPGQGTSIHLYFKKV